MVDRVSGYAFTARWSSEAGRRTEACGTAAFLRQKLGRSCVRATLCATRSTAESVRCKRGDMAAGQGAAIEVEGTSPECGWTSEGPLTEQGLRA